MQGKLNGKKSQGDLDPQNKQGSLDRASASERNVNPKVVAAVSFVMGMLVLLIIQGIIGHRSHKTENGQEISPEVSAETAEAAAETTAEATTEATAEALEEEEAAAEATAEALNEEDNDSSTEGENAAAIEAEEQSVIALIIGSIRIPQEIQEVVQLDCEAPEVIYDTANNEYYIYNFYVNDRVEPVFAIQEGGAAPENGLPLPGNAWVIPYYVTYDEHEKTAFDTGKEEKTGESEGSEADNYNIFDSCWFNFVRNAKEIMYCAEDGQEISLDQVMYSAEHRCSWYAEDPSVYYNDEYGVTLTFPEQTAGVFLQDENRGYKYNWWDHSTGAGELFQIIKGGSDGIHVLANIQFGPVGTEGDDEWAPNPIYMDNNCYVKIMLDSVEDLENEVENSYWYEYEPYVIMLNEAKITFPDGSEGVLGDFTR